MSLIALAIALIPAASAGPDPYTEEEAIDLSQAVLEVAATEVSCQGWIETGSDFTDYEARYEATLIVDSVIKGELSRDDIITVSFTEVVGETGEMDCGWFDMLLYPGMAARLYLMETGEGRYRQLQYAVPVVLDDTQLGDLPACEPEEEEEEIEEEETHSEEGEEGLEEETADGANGSEDEDAASSKQRGCQFVLAPASLGVFLPGLFAAISRRRLGQ